MLEVITPIIIVNFLTRRLVDLTSEAPTFFNHEHLPIGLKCRASYPFENENMKLENRTTARQRKPSWSLPDDFSLAAVRVRIDTGVCVQLLLIVTHR